jgi:flagellar basal body-associated protein FliL
MNANVPSPAPAPKKSNSSTIIIVVVIVALCLCCVLGATLYYLYQNGDQIFKTGAMLAQAL